MEKLSVYDAMAHFSELIERAESKLLAGWGQAKQKLPKA